MTFNSGEGLSGNGNKDAVVELIEHLAKRDLRLRHQEAAIRQLTQQVTAQEAQINLLNQAIAGRDNQIIAQEAQIDSLSKAMAEREGQIASLKQSKAEREGQISVILCSSSWRLTKPLRLLIDQLKRIRRWFWFSIHKILFASKRFDAEWYLKQNPDVAMSGMGPYKHYILFGKAEGRKPAPDESLVHRRKSSVFRLLRTTPQTIAKKGGIWRSSAAVLRVYRREGFAGIKYRMEQVVNGAPFLKSAKFKFDLKGIDHCVVLTTQHCEFVARQVQRVLARASIASKIQYGMPPEGYEDVPHFVICAQMFERLPKLYVAFQMEQSVSSRWFNEDYITRLENSYAILDYSLRNIEFLQKCGLNYRQIYYVPIQADTQQLGDAQSVAEKDIDVLFYGDPTSDRRKAILGALSLRCSVTVVSEVFGDQLGSYLDRAKIVLNVHYYEGALLETTRVFEALSRGCLVVSEDAVDQASYTELADIVEFVNVGDVEELARKIAFWIKNDEQRLEKLRRNREKLLGLPRMFDFYFMRFLLASDNLTFDEFYQLASEDYRLPNSKIVCLSLPESIDRQSAFLKLTSATIPIFPGLRHELGWIGCGLSYKFLTRKALESGRKVLAVCEDDVDLPTNWDSEVDDVLSFLSSSSHHWDFFCGMSANLPEKLEVCDVQRSNNRTYVFINTMVSMVFTVFSETGCLLVQGWDESCFDHNRNTIDRYIESLQGISVVITLPYLVGHREDEKSTLWGFQNIQYRDMTDRSVALLRERVSAFINSSDESV